MMKIRIAPFMLPLLLLTKCANYDLTNYHKIGEYWSCVFYDLNYLFEFNSYNDDEIFLTIKREEGFLRNNEIDNNIYVYSKSDQFDYLLINDTKLVEQVAPDVALVGYYCVGSDNNASFCVHSTLEKFKGYIKIEPQLQPTTSEPMHILRIDLY